MADLNVSIGATISDLKTALKNGKKELGGFADGAEKSAKKVTSNFSKSSEAVQLLDQKTGGLASKFVDVGNAAKLSGNAMRSALITSGIGIAVVALGLIVEHWEDIKNLIDDSNVKLQNHIDGIKRAEQALQGELKLSRIKEKILITEGKNTNAILNERKKIIGQIQAQNVLQLNALIAQDKRLDKLALEYSWWERIKQIASVGTGNVAATVVLPEYTEEEKKANAEREKAIQDLKIAIEETKLEAIKLNQTLSGSSSQGQSPLATLLQSYVSFKDELKPVAQDINSILSNSFTIPKRIVTDAEIELAKMKMVLDDFNKDANNIVQNGIARTFAGIGEAIGSSLTSSGTVLERLGKTLLSSMGAILTQLGEMAIKTGIGILAVQTALKSLNPYVAIAAGVALVAIGSAFSSAVSNIGSNNFGGSSTSGVAGGGSQNFTGGGNFSAQSGGGFSGGTVVFEIAGTKLVGVLSRTLARNKELGGNLGLTT